MNFVRSQRVCNVAPRLKVVGTLWIMELASNVATVEGMPELLPVLSRTMLPFASSDSVTPVPATRRRTKLLAESHTSVPLPAVEDMRWF